jgi:1-acyl-sn-glycerol-3-phosphate acyltransferase
MAHSQFRLLRERRFLPFFVTQGLGAFNDNVLKNALVIIVTYNAASYSNVNPSLLANLASALFILPFVLFSGISGELADRLDKARVLKTVKAAEIAIMALAGLGFYSHSLTLLLSALFLMGAHSTFFSPAKYGLLPQVLAEDELIGGNALVEMGTFVAILLGTLVAGILAGARRNDVLVGALAGIAALGFLVSLAIPPLAPVAPTLKVNLNPYVSSLHNLRAALRHRTVFLGLLGISWFWFFGLLVLTQLPQFGKVVLGGNESVITVMLLAFTTGVGIGSLLCERLGGHKIEVGLVPLGSIGLTLFSVDLFFAIPKVPIGVDLPWRTLFAAASARHVLIDLLLIGVSGGVFIVPLYALVQSRTERALMSRVMGANSILNALFMVVAALFGLVALRAGLTIPQLILVTAILNAVVTVYLYYLVPEFLLRLLAYLLVHAIYRLKVRGVEHLPQRGAALMVCNHVSFVDGLVIAAAFARPVRFVMEAAVFDNPLLRPIFRGMKAIPVATRAEDPAVREAAFAAVASALRSGEIVCIFPEGRLTSDGNVGEFRPGLLKILAETPVPVVPCALSNLWGSMFSRRAQGISRWLPRRFWARIGFAAGAPVPPESATPELLRARVLELRTRP